MMLYEVPSSFIKIDETKGILQNASSGNSLEVSNENEVNSGIILKPGESLSFQDTDIYIRTIGNKNSAVRVVPFVEGFSAGSSSSSGDFDIRKYDSTGILIYYKDAAGNLHEKPVPYVNPDSTNAQLVALGKSIIAVTDNTYQYTYRVTKSLCDPKLIVDLPLTKNFTDNCGNTWTATGNPSFADDALQIQSGQYLTCDEPLTLGGQDFTICGWAYMDSNTANYGRIFEFKVQDGNNWRLELTRLGTGGSLQLGLNNSRGEVLSSGGSNLTNTKFHFEVDYTNDDSTFRVFVNGSKIITRVAALARTTYQYAYLGYSKHSNGAQWIGSISNFQIYDGGALHSENFTPA